MTQTPFDFRINSNRGINERSIRLYDLKQALLILCKDAAQEDLIYEHFSLHCDHNRCVTRYRLKEMLAKVAQILLHVDRDFEMDWNPTNVIDEWFSKVCHFVTVNPSVELRPKNPFRFKCPGIVGLNEYQFSSFWVESKSIFRHYAQLMAVSQLISDTKDIVHPAIDCSLCKSDIRGLRLQCTVCSGYSLCFQCFCTDTNTENHTLSHRMGDGYILNKCRLFLKKFWDVFGCTEGTSPGNIQSIGMTTIKTNFNAFRQEFTTITNQNVSRQSHGSFSSRRNSHQIECKTEPCDVKPSCIRLQSIPSFYSWLRQIFVDNRSNSIRKWEAERSSHRAEWQWQWCKDQENYRKSSGDSEKSCASTWRLFGESSVFHFVSYGFDLTKKIVSFSDAFDGIPYLKYTISQSVHHSKM